MAKRHRLLFLHMGMTSFVKNDYDILSRHYDVINYEYRIEKGAGKKLIRFMLNQRKEYDAVFIWFGDVHATVGVNTGKALGKKTIVVAGGYDTTYIPEINYGFLSSRKNIMMAKTHFGLADRVLVVDESLKRNVVGRLGISDNKIYVVPTGYDPEFWTPPRDNKKDIVLSVAAVDSINRARIKGIDKVVELAGEMPVNRFIIVGVSEEIAEKLNPRQFPNLEILPEIPTEQLLKYYQTAKVYLQLSMTEGLPNSLCEAMLCECVPVATNVGGIPNAVGETGFIVAGQDMKELTNATIAAVDDMERGHLARERIKTMFPIEKREKSLVDTIDGLLA